MDRLVLLIATVIISAPEEWIAFKFSSKLLNLPLPIISLELYGVPAISKTSLLLEILFPPPIKLTISIVSLSIKIEFL